MKASDRQVSGSHYKSYAIQPAEFIQRNNLNWCEGNAIKYLVRHRDKKGAEDIRKAIHYLELLLEWEYPQEGAAAVIADVKRDNEPPAGYLCHSCQRNAPFKCHGEYLMTKDGGCEGYISALRENMLDAKQEVTATRISFPKGMAMTYTSVGGSHPDDCVNTDCCSYTQVLARNCSRYPMAFLKMCGLYKTATATQEAPTAAVLPLDFTLPPIMLKCTAEEAREKVESEKAEWCNAEIGSLHEMVERWDCLQALRTYFERNGKVEWYQNQVRFVLDDLSRYHAEGRDVMAAKAACLVKNAEREYYHPDVNAMIIASNGYSFAPYQGGPA